MVANIIVAFPRLDDAKNIKNILARSGFDVAAVCTTGAQALSYADGLGTGIIISSYKLADLPFFEIRDCMPPGFELLVLASKQRLAECESSGVVTLPMPFVISDFLDTVQMMVVAAQRRKKQAKQIPKKRNEEDRKLIDSAKKLLMERNGLSEDEAHKFIQKCSMDSGTNLVESAEMVLSMFERQAETNI